jgi:putative glutamine amidotransferase
MAKPIIGISASTLNIEQGPLVGDKRAFVNEAYIKAVAKSDGVPIIIPMTDSEEIIEMQLDGLDALLLSGGEDIDPSEYGESPKPKLNSTFPERDKFDRLLIKGAVKRGIPVLGICRGHQILNVAFGGSLYQDLDYIENCNKEHDQFDSLEPESHEIFLTKKSILNDILGDRIEVNSFHHLAIKDIAKGFVPTAFSEDGIIEGIEHKDYPFVVGVQWHPEILAISGEKKMEKLFSEFVISAKKQREKNQFSIAI